MRGDAQVKLNGASRQRYAPPWAASPSLLHRPGSPRGLAVSQFIKAGRVPMDDHQGGPAPLCRPREPRQGMVHERRPDGQEQAASHGGSPLARRISASAL